MLCGVVSWPLKLDSRNKLIAKKAKEGLSQTEEQELKRLRDYLDDLGFSKESRDPMYQLFIEQMYEARSQPLAKLLTAKELEDQEKMARRIVEELVKRDRTDDLSDLAKELKLQFGGIN